MDLASFVRQLPKAELHVHIEGTLEPEMMFELARRNGVDLPYASVSAVREAYDFDSLQSFLDLYYQGAAVLQTEQDFHDLMFAYLQRAHDDGVCRAEIFFDPQTHVERGIPFATFMDGFASAAAAAQSRFGISVGLIMCYLRHLGQAAALATWEASAGYRDRIIAVGLDSSEVGHPPEAFADVFRLARDAGLHVVAHAGEEGPSQYVMNAIKALEVERVDHGVRSEDDPSVIDRLVQDGIPLTMCPLSNVKLRVFERMEDHNLKRLLDSGVLVTVNSDDPAYFGGYVLDNYLAVAQALGLTIHEIGQLARNSIDAAFLPKAQRNDLLAKLDALMARAS